MERALDPNDDLLYAEPMTPEELAQERFSMIVYHDKRGLGITKFTCDGCPLAPRCTLAFDAYNTNGDCLLEK